jgi:RimJ/RimL family protein N-acetyltransferase
MSIAREVPVLKTERLLLRGAEASDFEDSAAMWGDPDVVKFIGGQTRGRQDAWFTLCRMRGMWDVVGYGNWVVCDRSTGQFLGEVGLANFMRGLKPDISDFPKPAGPMPDMRTARAMRPRRCRRSSTGPTRR